MQDDVVHWNPRRALIPGRLGRRVPLRRVRRIDNFGDLIGPLIVNAILEDRGMHRGRARARLLAVGSTLHLSRPGDVVWGAGVNGKIASLGGAPRLDVRAVRGPRTRERLILAGTSVPKVYGDPGLLWARYFPRSSAIPTDGWRSATIVPNFHDWPLHRADPRAVNPCWPLERVVTAIGASDLVVGSSLHGIIVAESFGIAARCVDSSVEPSFKYDDYYRGTGRPAYRSARTVEEAISWGGEDPPVWDAEGLIAAFPADLWDS